MDFGWSQSKSKSKIQKSELSNADKKMATIYDLAREYQMINLDSSIYFAKQLLELIDKNKKTNDTLKINAIDILAYSYEFKGDRKKAIEYYLLGIKYAKEKNAKKELADLYSGLGGLYYRKGEYPSSLKYYLKSIEINEKIGLHKQVITNTYIIGNIYLTVKDYVSAMKYQKMALDLSIKYNDKISEAYVYDSMASILDKTNRFDSSIVYLLKSFEIRKEMNDPYLFIWSYNNLGEWYEKNNQLDIALKYYQDFYRLVDSMNIEVGRAVANSNIGSVYFNQKKYTLANEYYTKGLNIAKAIGYNETIKECYDRLIILNAELGNYKLAFTYQKESMKLKDSLMNEAKNRDIADMQTKYETGKKELKLLQVKKRLAESKLKSKEKDLKLATAQQNATRNFWILLTVLFVSASVISFVVVSLRNKKRANILLEEKNRKIANQNLQLEDKQKEITDSINYAKRIQFSLLTHKEFMDKNLPEHFILFKPKDIVSGDFYWGSLQMNNNQNSFFLAVCDSTGHGVPGAFMSLLNISFLNEAINEKNIQVPSLVLDFVRMKLITAMENGKDGMDATLIKLDGNKMTYASANNKPVLIRNGELIELNSDKMPVGYEEIMHPFQSFELELRKNDLLYFFTDGYCDQFGGDKGKKLKFAKMKTILMEIHQLPLEEQKVVLNSKFEKWKGNLEQIDDVCIVGVRI